jgi:pyruvate/2-oxoglutarate dehydrogenase complex dihydrolipoamide acyltransferase (E2) component
MSVIITFPELSKDESAEGVLATWFVKTGERVKVGQIIAEVMVDPARRGRLCVAAGDADR